LHFAKRGHAKNGKVASLEMKMACDFHRKPFSGGAGNKLFREVLVRKCFIYHYLWDLALLEEARFVAKSDTESDTHFRKTTDLYSMEKGLFGRLYL
jgi:hypothetical protein